jgi:hypothetical protein
MGRVSIGVMGLEHSSLNHTQRLVLGFFAFAWAALVAISAFILVLGVGVVRCWRWTFWLVLVAFLLGVVRLPASALQLVGVLPAQGPAWYALLQAFLGVVQFAIGLVMLAGYRREGVWGSF